MHDPLSAYRGEEFARDELAEAASDLMDQYGLVPEDRRIRELDSRTIRYLQAQGLIDPPERRGREVVYSYLHLLQALALRRFQAQKYSLEAIKQLIEDGDLPWHSPSRLETALALDLEAGSKYSMDTTSSDELRFFSAAMPSLEEPDDEKKVPKKRGRTRSSRARTRAALFVGDDELQPMLQCRLAPGVILQIDPSKVRDAEVLIERLREALASMKDI